MHLDGQHLRLANDVGGVMFPEHTLAAAGLMAWAHVALVFVGIAACYGAALACRFKTGEPDKVIPVVAALVVIWTIWRVIQ